MARRCSLYVCAPRSVLRAAPRHLLAGSASGPLVRSTSVWLLDKTLRRVRGTALLFAVRPETNFLDKWSLYPRAHSGAAL
mmetsp:Transcript_33444/g.100915  ORF Transcript_33444/g.100915 Transcript_33444/m.100915 type:complete len:80 (+) Transcript_33444:1253-1492(+)